MSKYKLGDFVRLVEESAEGYITRIIDENMVAVTGEDGFEIPVPASKVTLVHGRMEREDDQAFQTEAVKNEEFIHEGVYLALTSEQKQGLVEFWLVNESSYHLLLAFNSKKNKTVLGEFHGELKPRSVVKIHAANSVSVGDWPLYNFQVIFFSEQWLDYKEPLIVDKRVRPVDISTSKKEVGLLGKKAWLFQLDEKNELEVDRLKEHFISHRPKR